MTKIAGWAMIWSGYDRNIIFRHYNLFFGSYDLRMMFLFYLVKIMYIIFTIYVINHR